MKTAAIIAEYNPFHTGHARQLQDIKHNYGVDTCLIIMSGNFVQRGTPAIVDKFTRAKWALQHGADIVFELPIPFSTAGAELFAYGACSLLNQLGFIDMLCFGSEITSIQIINTIAEVLLTPPLSFHNNIQQLLHQGKSYAAAREEALYPILMKNPDFYQPFYTLLKTSSFSERKTFHFLLSAPNTILGIEYCKALKKLNSTIKPVPMPRSGSSYHDITLPNSNNSENKMASASAIRHHLFHYPNHLEAISAFVPKDVLYDLSSLPLLDENDFSSYLYYALLGKTAEEICQYYEVSSDLAKRIYKKFSQFQTFSLFTEQLKTKQYAHARLNRALLHILLSIEKEEPFQEPAFLRLLALKKERSYLLKLINKQTRSIIITKAADAFKKLPPYHLKQLKKEIARSQLYGFTAYNQQNKKIYQELSISPFIL